MIISLHVDTSAKYYTLLALVALVNVSRVLVEEFGMPVLGFSVYNPDKKEIKDFTKNELQFLANSMFFTSGLRGLFMTMISISQFDIALFMLVTAEFTSFFTIRALLNEKTFSVSSLSSDSEKHKHSYAPVNQDTEKNDEKPDAFELSVVCEQ